MFDLISCSMVFYTRFCAFAKPFNGLQNMYFIFVRIVMTTFPIALFHTHQDQSMLNIIYISPFTYIYIIPH